MGIKPSSPDREGVPDPAAYGALASMAGGAAPLAGSVVRFPAMLNRLDYTALLEVRVPGPRPRLLAHPCGAFPESTVPLRPRREAPRGAACGSWAIARRRVRVAPVVCLARGR